MPIKNIFVTGDDGCDGVGVRLLIHFLKNRYKLNIFTTKEQQSGVGGGISAGERIQWGRKSIDGVDVFWVDSSPVDAVLFAKTYLKEKMDLIISGPNLGANIGGGYVTSGTFAAALAGLNAGLSSKALAISWDCSPDEWYKDGKEIDDVGVYLDYPGKAVKQIIDLAIANDFWGCELLNVNLPREESKRVVFTKPLDNICDFYCCSVDIGENHYNRVSGLQDAKADKNIDVGAIQSGRISITPCQPSLLKEEAYSKLKDITIELEANHLASEP